MKNYISEGKFLNAVCSHPATPKSGDPVLIGQIPGVAVTDEGDGGNASTETTVCTKGIFDLSVKGHNGSAGGAVGVGALIYYKTSATPVLNLDSSGVAFGYALEAIGSGATATIKVLLK